MDDIDHQLDRITVRVGKLETATLEKAADLLPLMVGPGGEIEIAVRRLANLLRSPAGPQGGATVHPIRPREA